MRDSEAREAGDWDAYVRSHLSLPDLARARESRIVRELASQLEDFHGDAIARGMTEAEADAYARAQITDWAQLAGTLRDVDRPHVRSRVDRWSEQLDDRARQRQGRWRLAADLWQDVRYACRRLAAQPGFTAVAALTLGLGIGLCCLLFSFLNGVLLQPLPGAREPERLVSLQAPVAYPDFEQFRDGSPIASAVAAFMGPVPFNVAVTGEGDARPEPIFGRIFGHIVSPEYFATLGVEPLLGRLFSPTADRAESATAVVVSERFWRTRLHADPAIVGRTLRINGGRATIVGVVAKDFLGVFPVSAADLFVPVTADPALVPELAGDALTSPASAQFRLLFRLAPGQTMGNVREAIEGRMRQIDRQFGRTEAGPDRPRRAPLLAAGGILPSPPELRRIPVVFFGVLILLILSFTCANLAGLTMARGDARSREIAVRLSLGASRFRLVRQLSTESLLLALCGGAAGFAAAYVLLALLVRTLAGTQGLPSALRLTPDLRVGALTFAITAFAGLIFGLVPALAATRSDLVRGLKDTVTLHAGRYRRFGLRNLFLVYQMTAATALTVVVGFMVAGVYRSASVDLGVDPDRASLFSLDLARDGYSRDEARTFLLALPERLATIDGVDRVSVAEGVPFNTLMANTPVSVPASVPTSVPTSKSAPASPTAPASPASPASPADAREAIHSVALQRIGPGYFAALGIPMLRGVEFTDEQLRRPRATPPEAGPADDAVLPIVINQTAARRLFGDRDPIGAVIDAPIQRDRRRLQVVGVVRYGKPPVFASEPAPTLMLPLTAADLVPGPAQGLTVVVRSRASLNLPAIAGALQKTDARASAFNLRTLRDGLAQLDRGVHYGTALYTILGVFAIGLASIGLAGVTAQAVARRRKEIGIRMALGAERWSVLRLVMREAIVMVSIGVALGLAAALTLGRLLAAMNTESGRTLGLGAANPLVLTAPLLLMLVAIVTSYLPARRSSTIDPLVTLREE